MKWRKIWKFIKPVLEVLILIVMTWASIESYNMRKEIERQTLNSTMPVIVFDIDKRAPHYFIPILKNVGYGPAFNISLTGVTNREFKIQFSKIVGLQKDGVIDCSFDVTDTTSNPKYFIRNDSLKLYEFFNYKGAHFGGRVSGQSFNSITISYKDIVGRTYITKQSLSFDWMEQSSKTSITSFPQIMPD